MVRSRGLEPPRFLTATSRQRVCRFRHERELLSLRKSANSVKIFRIGERGWIRTSAGLEALRFKRPVPSTAWLLVRGERCGTRTRGEVRRPAGLKGRSDRCSGQASIGRLGCGGEPPRFQTDLGTDDEASFAAEVVHPLTPHLHRLAAAGAMNAGCLFCGHRRSPC